MSILNSGIVRDAPPKDGLWSGGRYLGEPVGYQTWGWMQNEKPLIEIPVFDVVDTLGCTKEQVLSGLSIVDGYLRYDGSQANAAGAELSHQFRLLGPVFEKEGFEYSGRHWDESPVGTIGTQRWYMGVQTIDANGDPFIIQGGTSNIAKLGVPSRVFVFDDGKSAGTHGTSYKSWSFQLFPNTIRLWGMKTAIARYRITNGTNEYYVDDPRPTGVDDALYYFQPFIEIASARASTTQFRINFLDFIVLGTPKNT